MNQTKLGVGHFETVSGHFFAAYINSFHKTELIGAKILKSKAREGFASVPSALI